MLTSSTQLQNRSFHVVERTRTSSKCQKMKNARAKRAKIMFFIVKYANLWGFCRRRRRGCLSSLMSQCGNNNELALQHGGFCTTWSLVDLKSQKNLFNLTTSRILNLYGLIISEISAQKKNWRMWWQYRSCTVSTRTNTEEKCVPPSATLGVAQNRIRTVKFSNHTLWLHGLVVLSFAISRHSFRFYKRRFHEGKMANGPIWDKAITSRSNELSQRLWQVTDLRAIGGRIVVENIDLFFGTPCISQPFQHKKTKKRRPCWRIRYSSGNRTLFVFARFATSA